MTIFNPFQNNTQFMTPYPTTNMTPLPKPNQTPVPVQAPAINMTQQTPKVSTTAPAPITQTNPTASEPTAGQTYKQFSYDTTGTEYDKAYSAAINNAKSAANTQVDEDAIRRNTLAMFQAEIDAVNEIYAQKYKEQQTTGLGNLGSSTAIQARSGLLGSDFGQAQTRKVEQQNNEQLALINSEKAAKIGSIMGLVRQSVADEIKAKREAQQKGAKDYLDFLGKQAERNQTKLSNVAKAMLLNGLKPEDVDPAELDTLAEQLGVSKNELMLAYTAEEESQAAAKRKAELEGRFTLSEGQAMYNADGSIAAARAKTFAPKDSGSSYSAYGSEANQVAKDWAAAIVEGRAKLSDIPASEKGLRSAVAAELSSPQITQAKRDELEANKTLVDDLLGGNIKAITGIPNISRFIPGTKTQFDLNTLNQLRSILALENRQKLKGSGSISDFEARTLERAASRIGEGKGASNLGAEDFVTVLNEVKDAFQAAIDRASVSGSSGSSIQTLVDAAGYDYNQMKADGYSDAEIKQALGI